MGPGLGTLAGCLQSQCPKDRGTFLSPHPSGPVSKGEGVSLWGDSYFAGGGQGSGAALAMGSEDGLGPLLDGKEALVGRAAHGPRGSP